MASPASLKLLGTAILKKLGYPMNRSGVTTNHTWDIVREQLRRRRIDVLHLDEAQDILQHDTPKEMSAVVATLRSLVQDAQWPLILVLSGTRDLAELINSDPQPARRLRSAGLDRITVTSHGYAVAKVIELFSAKAGLSLAADILFGDLIERLIHGASQQFGVAVEIVIEAIALAFEDGRGILHADDFGVAYRHWKGASTKRTRSGAHPWTMSMQERSWVELVRSGPMRGRPEAGKPNDPAGR